MIALVFMLTTVSMGGLPEGPASFRPLGDLPGGGFGSQAYDVSSDGSIVVGIANHTTGADSVAFRWSASEGISALGPILGGQSSGAMAVSGDGAVIVGYGTSASAGTRAFRWTVAEGMLVLPSLSGNPTQSTRAFDVSQDGSVIVGISGPEAFRWSAIGGIEGLGVLSGAQPYNSDAYGASFDGGIVIGQSHASDGFSHSYRWTAESGMLAMVPHPGDSTWARAITPDGAAVVGVVGFHSLGRTEAFLWTASSGYVLLGSLPGTNTATAHALSGDGQVVVGDAQDGNGHGWAFVWTPDLGIRDLKAVLETDYKLDLGGWQLQYAHGISDDGTTIVGWGIDPCGHSQAWMVRLAPPLLEQPAPCPGDVNGDRAVDFADLNELLARFNQPAICGDLDVDGWVGFADLNLLLAHYSEQCQ